MGTYSTFKGTLEVIKPLPNEIKEKLTKFKIQISKNGEEAIIESAYETKIYSVHTITQFLVLSHFMKGTINIECEENDWKGTRTISISKDELIDVSERRSWNPEFSTYQKEYEEHDRVWFELNKLGLLEFYPKWLEDIKKENKRSFVYF